jgi:hypothetical protein
LNFLTYLENDPNSDNNEIQSPAKKSKSDSKDKAKTTSYDYKKKKTSYNSAEKNNISKKDSASEYKNKTESEADINNEIK